ncbi:MAG: zinc-binding dehydrogenase [Rhodospirillales bacterium]|nr:zinc-binding dehydrogenase [Rhodospirillales bacterium]
MRIVLRARQAAHDAVGVVVHAVDAGRVDLDRRLERAARHLEVANVRTARASGEALLGDAGRRGAVGRGGVLVAVGGRRRLGHLEVLSDLEHAAADLFDVVAKGAVKIQVNQTFALKDAAAAHIALESRKTTGSTVLIP